jgi:dienelactone hydrolase
VEATAVPYRQGMSMRLAFNRIGVLPGLLILLLPATGAFGEHVQSEAAQAFRKTAEVVSFPSGDATLKGWLYKPRGDGRWPAVIWNHGSERRPTAHPELGKFYTEHGFVLFLPIRQGHEGSPGTYIQDQIDAYSAQVHDKGLVRKRSVELQEVYNKDVEAAVAWLKEQPFVDPHNIVVSGCSYGGIQTLLAAEKRMGVKAFVPFAPGAMSWANPELRKRLLDAAKGAKAPVFLLQASNDYSTGPSEVLGKVLEQRSDGSRAKVYPVFGKTNQEGHGGFACWEEGIAIWGDDVIRFLAAAGVGH